MTKKTKALAPPPAVNIFGKIPHETWRKLTILAATLGIGRLDLYTYALMWAADSEDFANFMEKYVLDKPKKAKK